MKAPFPDMCLFSLFQPPPCSLLSRFDLGRYCHVPYIPIFGKVDDVSGNIYPMLRELGGGYGSVELNYELPHTQTCKLKCYPKLVHYLKAHNIGVDSSWWSWKISLRLPIWTGHLRHTALIDDLLWSGQKVSVGWRRCAWERRHHHEEDSSWWVHHIPDQCSRRSEGCGTLPWEDIINSFRCAEVSHEVMNAAGYCSTKWIGYCRTKEEKKMEQIRVV